VLHASTDYARIHELMWESWRVAGGYWRDADAELAKFRDAGARRDIAAIAREAGRLDGEAAIHLRSALAAWDKSHSYYMAS
jgi:hypothetical protein